MRSIGSAFGEKGRHLSGRIRECPLPEPKRLQRTVCKRPPCGNHFALHLQFGRCPDWQLSLDANSPVYCQERHIGRLFSGFSMERCALVDYHRGRFELWLSGRLSRAHALHIDHSTFKNAAMVASSGAEATIAMNSMVKRKCQSATFQRFLAPGRGAAAHLSVQ
jgi:hypothetical protein